MELSSSAAAAGSTRGSHSVYGSSLPQVQGSDPALAAATAATEKAFGSALVSSDPNAPPTAVLQAYMACLHGVSSPSSDPAASAASAVSAAPQSGPLEAFLQNLDALTPRGGTGSLKAGSGPGGVGAGAPGGVVSQEAAAWSLIAPLYEERVASAVDVNHAAVAIPSLGGSDAQAVDALLGGSQFLREAKIVVEWLEQLYGDGLDKHTMEDADWRATLSALRTSATHPVGMVMALDPDAPLRGSADGPSAGGSLHPDDEDLEERLLRHLWCLVRAGKLSEAAEVCRHVGQPWRAQSLAGGLLFHDATFAGESGLESGALDPVVGNPDRLLWKQMCVLLSQSSPSMYERALYGALAGHLDAVLPLCVSWEDHVWARYHAALQGAVDRHLASVRPSATKNLLPQVEPVPGLASDSEFTPDAVHSIFSTIASGESAAQLRAEATSPFQTLEQLLILSRESEALVALASWALDETPEAGAALAALGASAAAGRATLLRFGASLVLFFRSIDLVLTGDAERAGLALLRGYVDHLITTGQAGLIALYTAHLPASYQVSTYARFLESVEETEQRKACLRLARNAGLDVLAITSRVVRNMHSPSPSALLPSAETSAEDTRKVRALEWLTFDESQRTEALIRALALARSLLLSHTGELSAYPSTPARSMGGTMTPASAVSAQLEIVPQAKLAMTRELLTEVLPSSTIEALWDEWGSAGVTDDPPPLQANAVHEFQSLVAYLKVLDAYESWTHALFKRPSPPTHAESNRYFDELMYEQEARAYLEAFNQWSGSMEEITAATLEAIKNALEFPGGWLVDVADPDSYDNPGPGVGLDDPGNRVRQLEMIRALCIPSMCFMLHRVLYDTHDFQGSLQVADLVADPFLNLAAAFSPAELEVLLKVLRLSSLQLLESDGTRDPLGYDSVASAS